MNWSWTRYFLETPWPAQMPPSRCLHHERTISFTSRCQWIGAGQGTSSKHHGQLKCHQADACIMSVQQSNSPNWAHDHAVHHDRISSKVKTMASSSNATKPMLASWAYNQIFQLGLMIMLCIMSVYPARQKRWPSQMPPNRCLHHELLCHNVELMWITNAKRWPCPPCCCICIMHGCTLESKLINDARTPVQHWQNEISEHIFAWFKCSIIACNITMPSISLQ